MVLSLLNSRSEGSGSALPRRPVATPNRAGLSCEEQAQRQEPQDMQEQRAAPPQAARKGARQVAPQFEQQLRSDLGQQETARVSVASGTSLSAAAITSPSVASSMVPSATSIVSPRVSSDISAQPSTGLLEGVLRGRNAIKCDVRIELGKGQQMRVCDGKGFISKQGLVVREQAAGTMGFCREVELSPNTVREVRDRFVSEGKATFLVSEAGFGSVTVMVSKADPELLAALVRGLKPMAGSQSC